MTYNQHSHNFQILLIHAITLLNDAKTFTSSSGLRDACNALHLVTSVVKTAASDLYDAEQLTALFAAPESLPFPAGTAHHGEARG